MEAIIIILLFWTAFVIADAIIYIKIPYFFRTKFEKWRYLPGGGIIILIKYLLWKQH